MAVRTENKKRTISKIVKTLYELIQEKDYEKISIRDIKNKAKISIGAIYHHFPQGKADILHEMIKRNRNKILNTDLFTKISESNLEISIKATMLNFIRFHRENLQFHLAFERLLSLNKDILVDFKELIEETLEKLAKKFKTFDVFRAIPEKELREKLFLLFNVIESIILRHILIVPLFKSDEEFGDYLTELYLLHFSN
ncbi:MAG: TetR/AcrR family transcriptional regulator [Promethearchaeota archaeon]